MIRSVLIATFIFLERKRRLGEETIPVIRVNIAPPISVLYLKGGEIGDVVTRSNRVPALQFRNQQHGFAARDVYVLKPVVGFELLARPRQPIGELGVGSLTVPCLAAKNIPMMDIRKLREDFRRLALVHDVSRGDPLRKMGLSQRGCVRRNLVFIETTA